MARAFLRIFFDFEEKTAALTEEERGRLLLGMLRYAETGAEPVLTGNEAILWPVFRKEVDGDIAAYETRVQNGSKGGRPPKNAAGDAGTEVKPEPETQEPEESGIAVFMQTETGQNRKKPEKTETNRNGEEQEQEQDRYCDDDDVLGARAREEVGRAFSEHIGRAGMPEELRQICVAASAAGAGTEMAVEAVRLAAKNGARAPAEYVKKILEEWSDHGIRTAEEAFQYRMRSGRAGILSALFARPELAGGEA